MILERFAELVPGARRYGKGFRGPCPACGGSDRSSKFSFCERDGKILIKCFSGCDASDVCESLGLELHDLFTDTGLTIEQRRALPPQQQKPNWRALSSTLQFDAESHWLKSEAIFKQAQKIDPETLSDDEMDQAWQFLEVAFDSQTRCERLLDEAFAMRQKGLHDEAARLKTTKNRSVA